MNFLSTIAHDKGARRSAALTVIAVILSWASAFPADDYSTWGNWRYVYLITKTTAPGANVTTTQTNFPVLVRLNPGNFDGLSNTADDGSDIRFSKADGTHLYYQLERWQHTSATIDTAEFWVLVPSVTGNDTTKLKMYWNKSGAVDSSLPRMVFDTANGFRGVWHLKEAGTNTTYYDATANGYSGTGVNTTTGSSVPAISGMGCGFDGSSSYVSSTGFTNSNFSALTISTWVKLDNQSAWGEIVSKSTGDYGSAGFGLRRSDIDKFAFTFYNNGAKRELIASSTFTDNSATWYLVTGTYNGSAQRLYVNGAEAATAVTGLSGVITGSTSALNIGRRPDPVDNYIDGVLDEVVISNTARSADWIKLCYQNQRLTNGRDSLVWYSSSSSSSVNYTWDNSTSSNIQAGSGTWGTDSYWTADGGGTVLTAWPGYGNATFAGTDGSYTITINGTQNADSIAFLNSGYTLSGGTAVNFGANSGILVASSKTAAISTPVAGSGDVTKYGAGTLTLSGANTFTGALTVNGGTLSVTGSYNNGAGGTFIGTTANGKMTISGTVTTDSIRMGSAANVSGALYQTAGTLTISNSNAAERFPLGWTTNGYGYYGLSGGTMSVSEIGVGSYYNGDGLFELSGGTATFNTWFIVGRSETSSSTQLGVVNISGGTMVTPSTGTRIGWSSTSGATSVLNMTGGTINGVTNSTDLQFNTNASINLNGGTIQVQRVTNSSAGRFNFNGGTLKANTANATFFANAGSAYVWPGGAIIDDNGVAITVSQVLATPSGSGVVVGTPPSVTGLISPPVVRVSGTGTGACAVATIDGSGNLSGVTVTNPGTGYTGTPTFTLSGGGMSSSQAFSGTVAANTSGGLTKQGSGTLTLSGANTFTGAVSITAGTLKNGAAGVIADAVAVSLSNVSGATWDLNNYAETVGSISGGGATGGNIMLGNATLTCGGNNTSTSYSGVISETGGLTKAGSGTTTLSRANTYSGATTVSAGTLKLGASGVIPDGSGKGNVSLTGTLDLNSYSEGINGLSGAGTVTSSAAGSPILTVGNNNATSTFSGAIANGSGTTALTKAGTGTTSLSGTNTYTGTTTVSAGTLSIGAGGAGGSISNSTSITDNGTLAFNLSGVYICSVPITGSGAVTQAGGGTTNLSSTSNAWSGTTTISAGTLQLGASGVIPDGSGKGNVSVTGTFDLNSYSEGINGLSGAGTVTTASGTPTLTVGNNDQTSTFSGVIQNGSGNIKLTKAGTGTLSLSGANTYTGITTINATGTLSIGASAATGAISNSSNVTDNGTLAFNRSNAYAYTGAISGSGAVMQAGAGETTISGANTYSGGTTVSAGRLNVDGTVAGAVSVTGGTLGGMGALSGTVSVSSGGTLSAGSSSATAALTINNNVALASGATLRIKINGTLAATNHDQLAVNGTVDLAGATLTITLGFIPNLNDTFLVLANDGGDAITNTFAGIAQGGTVTTIFNNSTYAFMVNYAGGTGNDIVLTAAGMRDENYAEWLYSQKIFINTAPGGAQTGTAVYNFPVMIRLDSSTFFRFYQTAANGADIRFANRNGTHLYFEIERWKDNTGDNDSAVIWVKVDTLRANDWSNCITMYWGNPSATSGSDSTHVFDTSNGYIGVWHLAQDPSGGAGTVKNSTANALNATPKGSMPSTDLVDGMIGKGHLFDGIDDADSIPYAAALNTANAVTLSAWVKVTAFQAFSRIISRGSSLGNNNPWTVYSLNTNNLNNQLRAEVSTDVATSQIGCLGKNNMNTGVWYYAAFTYDKSNLKVYRDGVQDSISIANTNILGTPSSVPLMIGKSHYVSNPFSGVIDEPIVSNVARSADWIRLCYQTQQASNRLVVDIENYADWPYSQTVTVNTSSTGANVSGNVTNFPMLVRLNPSNFGGFANTLALGADVRFAKSNGVHLPYEIERWVDVTGNIDTASIWVLIDTVLGNNATQTFTMYWGKTGTTATTRSSPTTVFDTANTFAAVWHLNQNPATGGACMLDQTLYAGNGTPNGTMIAADSVKAVIGTGIDFDGTDDYLQTTSSTNNGTRTLSAWINPRTSDDVAVIENVIDGDVFGQFGQGWGLDNSYIKVLLDDQIWTTAKTVTLNQWQHVALKFNATKAVLYYNGLPNDSLTYTQGAITSTNYTIGKSNTNALYFDGYVDELRVNNGFASADWIKLCYETQKPNSQAAVTENYAEWPYSQKIYLNTTGFSGANISAGVGNFPVLVRLDTVNFRYFNQTLANGADLRFANSSGAQLSYEIERWQDNAGSNDTAVIWVKVDTILPNSGTQYITMYWGKNNVASMSNGPMVFDVTKGFSGAWHLGDNTFSDATSNNYDGTSAGTSDTVGIIGRARKFIAANRDSIQIAGLMGSPATVTLSCWVKCDSIDQAGPAAELISIGDNAQIRVVGGARDSLNGLYHYNSAWNTTLQSSGGANLILRNGWKHIAYVNNPSGSSQTIYINGISVGTSAYSNALYYTGTGSNTYIGKHGNGGANNDFGGVIDEPRIENTNRSASWVRLCYENQKTSQTLCDYEDYSTWRNSRRITINTGAGGISLSGNVNNFPLLVRLDATNFDFSEANGSTDIRFARSDGTHLIYETERWDSTNRTAELWVLVDTVRNANATQYITMHWGKTGAFSKSNPERVFDTANSFQGAWHMSESSGSAIDATINSYDATRSGNTAQTAGGIGYGQTFDGTDDYFTATNVTKVGFGTIFTSSAWLYFSSSVTGPGALWSLSDGDANWEAQETQAMLGDKTLNVSQSGRYPQLVGHGRGWIQPTNALGADGWHYITYIFNSSGPVRQIYIDGTSETLTQTSYASGTDAGTTFIIGNKVSTDVNADFNGKMDELRIENVVRSADWIKLCYETQKPSPTVTMTDAEAFRPCSLKVSTTAVQCSVWTRGWTLVFDKAASGAGTYGGISILTDSAHGKTTGTNPLYPSNNVASGQNLFYVTYDGVTSLSPSSGAWSADTLGRIAAIVRQTCTMSSLPFTIDYTIHGSGKMFIKVGVTNTTGSDISGKTLQFNLQRRVVSNTTVSIGNSTVTLCPYVLVSCDSARHIDPLLVPFTLWKTDSGAATSATALINTPAIGLAGYSCTTGWAIAAGQRQTWDFMLDFSHKCWNDSNGVGAYARSYRTPDSLEFLTGCPTLELAWEEYLFGHWKLDETTGDSAYDKSGAAAHGTKTSAASWTTGRLGGGLALNGSQYITVTDRSNLGGTAGGITLMAWIKPTSAISTGSVIMGKYAAATGYQFLGTADGKLSFKADGTTISDTTTVGTGAWRHVAVTCNTILDTTKFYIDGRLVRISSGAYAITANNAAIQIGNGFIGTIDDARYYGQALDETAVRAIWKLGYQPDKGIYTVRADNSNTVYLKIDGGTNKRRFPVFQVDNYWGSADPATGCVIDNGMTLVKNVDYFTYLSTIYRKLFIAFNKTVGADSTLIYVDDKSQDGARTRGATRKMVWGKYSGIRNWFWCKNFSDMNFGASGTNQFYFAWKMDSTSTTGSTSRGGEVCRFKSSNLSPNAAADTSTTNSLVSSNAQIGGTPVGYQNFTCGAAGNVSVLSTYNSTIPTYSVVESSSVRIQLQLNERTVGATSETAVLTTRWTIYPTGQIYRWDSIRSFSTAPKQAYAGCDYQKYATDTTFTINKAKMRGSHGSTATIHDNVVAFLGWRNSTDTLKYPWKGSPTDTLAVGTGSTERSGMRFGMDTTGVKTKWAAMPIQMAFYYDYQRSNWSGTADVAYRDSVSNGVQCISKGGGPALSMLAGTLVTNSSGDLNSDGFNEREGAYIVSATNNQACFMLPAQSDTCRFYPAFRITNYLASQKPQYVYCYHLHDMAGPDTLALLEGYEYNMSLRSSSHELVVQIDSVFCDSTVFYLSPDRSLAVTVSKFDAAGGDGCDTVKWRTESENENLGYYIYRRVQPRFFDSITGSLQLPVSVSENETGEDSSADDPAVLFKRKLIASADTGWVLLNEKIIPGAPEGASVGPRDYLHIDGRVYNGVLYEYKVVAVDFKNKTGTYGPAQAKPGRRLPLKFALGKIYPNPFRKTTFIRFDLPVKTTIELDIYNIQGKLIRRLLRADKKYPAGFHRIVWDGMNEQRQFVATGTYLCRLNAGKYVNTKVMIRLK